MKMKTFNNLEDYKEFTKRHISITDQGAEKMSDMFLFLGYNNGEQISQDWKENEKVAELGWTELICDEGGEIYKDGNLVLTYWISPQTGEMEVFYPAKGELR